MDWREQVKAYEERGERAARDAEQAHRDAARYRLEAMRHAADAVRKEKSARVMLWGFRIYLVFAAALVAGVILYVVLH